MAWSHTVKAWVSWLSRRLPRAPGQSGRPGSPHYDDQVRPWLDGGYHTTLYDREDVEREAEATLALMPAT